MDLPEIHEWRQKTLVGVSLKVVVPPVNMTRQNWSTADDGVEQSRSVNRCIIATDVPLKVTHPERQRRDDIGEASLRTVNTNSCCKARSTAPLRSRREEIYAIMDRDEM
jgi:hypothetical protein